MSFEHREAPAGSGLAQFTADEADERRGYTARSLSPQAPPRILTLHWFRHHELGTALWLAS
jgi:hypothetical protein